jgi:hypothetical protein
MDDWLGPFSAFCDCNMWSELMCKHNDHTDSYHLSLFGFVVIGSKVKAE